MNESNIIRFCDEGAEPTPEKKTLCAYERALQGRELARRGKPPRIVAGETIGRALEAHLRNEGFPITVEPPSGVVAYQIRVDREEVSVIVIKETIKISGKIGVDTTINIVSNTDRLSQAAMNETVCEWLVKRISNQA